MSRLVVLLLAVLAQFGARAGRPMQQKQAMTGRGLSTALAWLRDTHTDTSGRRRLTAFVPAPFAPASASLPFANRSDYPNVSSCSYDVISGRCEPTNNLLLTADALAYANASEMAYGAW